LIFAAAWILALAVVEFRNAQNKGKPTGNLAHVALAVGVIAAVVLPQIWIRSTTNAPLAGQTWLEGWSIGNFFARTFDNVDGHFDYALPVAIFYGQVFAHPAYLFVLLTPFLAIGSIALWKRMNSSLPLNILLLGWILGMYIFLAGIPYENFRFALGLFAPIAVVTGMGGGWLWERWRASRWRFALIGWIGVALLVMLVWQPRVLAPVLEIKARELRAVQWLAAQLPTNAHLYTMSIDGAVKTYSQIRVSNLWEFEPSELDAPVPTYLYVDTVNIEQQWRGLVPDHLLRRLSETRDLELLANFDGSTLFRVR
jgi:hypothetical protein